MTPAQEGEVSPDPPDSEIDVGRDRLVRVFQFLEALNQHRSPVKRLLSNHPWCMYLRNLPDHSAVTIDLSAPSSPETPTPTEAEAGEAVILRVKRPQLTKAPAPPDSIADWLEPGCDHPNGPIRTRQ